MTVTYLPGAVLPERDRRARFAEEVHPLLDVLARGARRLTRSDADAEDLLQDTLMRAYLGFHTFSEGTNLKAWMFRILYNRWVSAHRAKQSRVTEVPVEDISERDLAAGAARLPGGVPSAEEEVLETLGDGDIRAAMTALPDGFAEVLFYADVEGYTYAETAEILDIPIGTVMSRVSRARRRLRLTLAHRDLGAPAPVAAAVIA